jgi:hypothetical protein
MIFFGSPGDIPFQRPPQAGPNFVPRSIDVRMYSDIDPYPQFMPPVTASYPSGIHLPLEAEPAGGAAATVAPATAPVAGLGAISPQALSQRGSMALPASVRTAITAGKIRGRLGKTSSLVARGRNPGG